MIVAEQTNGLVAVCRSRTGTAHLTRMLRERRLTLDRIDELDPHEVLDSELGQTRWTEVKDSDGRTVHQLLAAGEEEVGLSRQERVVQVSPDRLGITFDYDVANRVGLEEGQAVQVEVTRDRQIMISVLR